MSTLHFCRDGILRRDFTRYDRKTKTRLESLVPLRAYVSAIDPHAFYKSLHSAIVFEDGLTVGEMMENLAPWAEEMIGVGVLDFPAFLEEMRRDPAEKVDDVARIVLRYRATLKPVPDFHPASNDDLFGEPKATGRIEIEQYWDMDAELTEAGIKSYDGATTVAIDYTPMSEWKHLPIVIDEVCTLHDETASDLSQAYLGIRQPITDASHPLVKEHSSSQGEVYRHDLTMDAPYANFFNTLIRGFMWEVGFSYSPAQRDEEVEKMHGAMSELEAHLEEGEDPELIASNSFSEEKANAEDDVEFAYLTLQLDKIRAESDALEIADAIRNE